MKYILINTQTNIIDNFWTVPDTFDKSLVNEPNVIIHEYSFEYLPDMQSAGLISMNIVDDIIVDIDYVPRPKTLKDWVFQDGVWVDKTTNIMKFDELRFKRTSELLKSDWTQSPDSPLTPELKEDWRVWRQDMRDVVNTLIPPDVCTQNFNLLLQNKPV